MFARRSFLRSVSLALFAISFSVSPAAGQGYKIDPVDAAARKASSWSKKVLKGTTSLDAQFNAYYEKYLFPVLTQPENQGKIVAVRQGITKDLYDSKSTAAHDRLVALTLREMTKYAEGNYNPVLRVNAMLLIGNLNSVEKPLNRQRAYLQSLPVMLKAIDAPDQIDGVRVAALQGLQRHVRLDKTQNVISDAVRKNIVTSLGNLAAASAPPTGRSADGHNWMRREAVEILGILGDGNGVSAILAGIIDDAKQPLSLRCSAALALGQLSSIQVDASKSLEKLANMAALACRQELLALQDIVAKKQAGNQRPGAGRPGRELAVDPKQKTDPKVTMSQVRLRYRLQCVKSGLAGYPAPGGLKKMAAAGPEKVAIDDMVSQINDLLSVIIIDTRPRAKYVDAGELMKQIQQLSRPLITKYAAIVEDTDERTAGVQ